MSVTGVEDQEDATLDDSVPFLLLDLQIDGSTVYAAEELAPLWERYLGQEISLRELNAIAAAITVRYRNDGYVLSRAVVPDQDVTEGFVRIKVFEGFIDEVVIEGKFTRPKLWEAYVEQLKSSRPLRAADLERTLLLLNDLPGNSTRAILNASENTPGASTLTLVAASSPFTVFLDTNNRGTRYLGPYQADIGASFDSWTGRYESTSVWFNQTFNDNLSFASLAHSEIICACGTQLTVSGAYVRTKPGNQLSGLDVDGNSIAASLEISHPWIRTRGTNLSAHFDFDFLNSENDVSRQSLSRDRVRSIRMGASMDHADGLQGVSLGMFEISQGLPILDATDSDSGNPSRPGADGTYTKLSGRIQRLQSIGPGFSLLFRAAGQYSFDELLAPEQFTYGGDDFGRGYDPAELIGDDGIAGLVELQWGRAFGYKWFEGLQVFASYDYGITWNRNASQPEGSRTSGSSIAAGFRANLSSWLSTRFMVARPLTRPATIDRDDGEHEFRFFYGLTVRYF